MSIHQINYFNFNFLNNKYTKWYITIIQNALARDEVTSYTEIHHIIPRSFGGSNDKSNLIKLLVREHYVVHLLLPKMVSGQHKYKMQVALWNMMIKSDKRHMPNNKQYELIKENMASALSKLNKGKPSKLKGIPSGKIPWNKGLVGLRYHYSEEAKEKLKAPKNKETRERISQSIKNHKIKKGYTPVPKMKFILKNIITKEIAETTNITKWCKENGFNSSWLYRDKSNWKIIEKYKLKDGSKIL